MTALSSPSLESLDQYIHGLGTLFSKLQMLEFQLRIFLYEKSSRPHNPFSSGQNLTGLLVGTELPVNAVTDWAALGDLIQRYNVIVTCWKPELEIDRDLVVLRDALAHGRFFVTNTGREVQLVKFTKPAKGRVQVQVNFAATVTPQWIEQQCALVQLGIDNLRAAIQWGRPPRFPDLATTRQLS